MKRTTYKFYGPMIETADGMTRDQIASATLDSDAQAELYVNHLRDEGRIPRDDNGDVCEGLTIARGNTTWFSRGV